MLKINSILNVRVILPLQSISAFLMHIVAHLMSILNEFAVADMIEIYIN
jgi:hypothetical protein